MSLFRIKQSFEFNLSWWNVYGMGWDVGKENAEDETHFKEGPKFCLKFANKSSSLNQIIQLIESG